MTKGTPLISKKAIKKRLKLAYKKLRRRIPSHAEASLLLLGQQMSRQVAVVPPNTSFREVGFKVFSQWDEDGIIQYLITHLPIQNKTFIEFGVEDYEESNTRFLLLKDHWQGMVLDACESDIRFIQTDKISWEFDLQAKCAWITRENVDFLLRETGFSEDVGLLSIDIDGNEYWIWEAIQSVRPRIVIIEYNSVFGLQPISVPYNESFHKLSAHDSGLYYGCSIAALYHLAKKKGYILVGSNIWGHNAFFIRSDVAGGFKGLEPEEAYVLSKYRESRDRAQNLTYVRGEDRMNLIEHLPVTNVVTRQEGTLKEFHRQQ
jgi:hypothetical protein